MNKLKEKEGFNNKKFYFAFLFVFFLLGIFDLFFITDGNVGFNFFPFVCGESLEVQADLNDAIFEYAKLLPSKGKADNLFGYSVSISGDYAIVGMTAEEGDPVSVFIFKKNLKGEFEELDELSIPSGKKSDSFFTYSYGYVVFIYGDYAVVGAESSATVYVFKKNSIGRFEPVQKIMAYDGERGDFFGHSVSIFEDYLVIGAPWDNDMGNNSGSAYIFKKNSTGQFEFVNKLVASDGEKADNFGESISIFEDYAIVGASADGDKGIGSGSAYIFKKNSTGQFEFVNKLVASDGNKLNFFGNSVSISGDYAIVGAYRNSSAYIFKKNSEGKFEELQKIVPFDEIGYAFGSSVSIYGDYIVVGANEGVGKKYRSGSAYLFKKNSVGKFEELSKILASDGATGDQFGNSVSIYGDYIVVGSPQDDDNGWTSGSGYIYDLSNLNISNLDTNSNPDTSSNLNTKSNVENTKSNSNTESNLDSGSNLGVKPNEENLEYSSSSKRQIIFISAALFLVIGLITVIWFLISLRRKPI